MMKRNFCDWTLELRTQRFVPSIGKNVKKVDQAKFGGTVNFQFKEVFRFKQEFHLEID